jgi:hypothetical protein
MEDALVCLHKHLASCRRLATSGQDFFIYEDLSKRITTVLIADVIHQSVPGVRDHRLSITAERIRDNGLRIFCILIVIDDRLPVRTVGELCEIAPDLDHEQFMAVQWQFVPWVFENHSIHVILPDNIVLPFLEEELIAEGAGGTVSKISIPGTLEHISGSEYVRSMFDHVR